MMKKIIWLLLIVCIGVIVLPVADVDAMTLCTEFSYGDNRNGQNYDKYGETIESYLSLCEDGTLMRFQYSWQSNCYIVEYYDTSYQLLNTKKIDVELPAFGAFYAGKNYYFILTGQSNKEESETVECYRITKYDKNWNRLGSTGLYDCNTVEPFDFGSARLTEYNGYLLIHTCHSMYMSSDGLNHQANVTIQFDIDKMLITNDAVGISNPSYGYVSHSFNQFIQVEDGKIITVDQGDAYPRSIALMKYNTNISDEEFGDTENKDLLNIPGEIGDNFTGVSIGGFEISDTAYLVVGNKIDFESGDNNVRNIFVNVLSKNGEIRLDMITKYNEKKKSASTPHIVKTGLNEFLLLWSSQNIVYYTRLDGNGKQTDGKIYKLKGKLSDCVPIVFNEKIIWYTYKKNKVTFYEIENKELSENRSITVNNGHTFNFKKVKNSVATLKCEKCGKTKLVHTPKSFSIHYLWSLESEIEVEYLIISKMKKVAKGNEQNKNFILKCSDPTAMKVIPYKDDIFDGKIIFQKSGKYTLTICHEYDNSLSEKFTFIVKGKGKKRHIESYYSQRN